MNRLPNSSSSERRQDPRRQDFIRRLEPHLEDLERSIQAIRSLFAEFSENAQSESGALSPFDTPDSSDRGQLMTKSLHPRGVSARGPQVTKSLLEGAGENGGMKKVRLTAGHP
ncbi:hypothetical protein BDR05DRAFT_353211 [Suillus weaverae]|nr:hypothetical protein BDR05DRAFT_353211 [Suillus weaverae]